MPEAQMRDSDTTGFFRIVGEVTLRIHIRMVADNLDRAFVGADSAVTAQAPEFTAFGRGRSSIQRGSYRQRGIGNIVNDAYSEIIFRFCCGRDSGRTASTSDGVKLFHDPGHNGRR